MKFQGIIQECAFLITVCVCVFFMSQCASKQAQEEADTAREAIRNGLQQSWTGKWVKP